ncbi:MAG: hypothetical protein AUJ56_08895 [Zetaproteobacteria bacterium CG1_02_49_23]|nr:MAG: hypothetical protein AUJ56_08895 [Zetaproteobacteria bacterium CG1_02_49_23]
MGIKNRCICLIHIFALAITLLCLPVSRPALAGVCDAQQLSILTYNVFMRPEAPGFWYNNKFRADAIPDKLRDADVVIFQEAFDDAARAILLKKLGEHYTESSKVLGKDTLFRQDGGIILLSKWSIKKQDQLVFSDTSFTDGLARKGSVYAMIEKTEATRTQRYHIFGIHLNASDSGANIDIQNAQLRQLVNFIEQQHIPPHEPAIIAGDFNIDPTSDNYQFMLETLHSNHLKRDGEFTFDASKNDLVSKLHKLFDHVLFNVSNAPNTSKSTISIEHPRAEHPWKGWIFGKKHNDLSDHFPLYVNYCFDHIAPQENL